MATGSLIKRDRGNEVAALQHTAWMYYGWPATRSHSGKTLNVSPVGEVRYVIGWMADQHSRLGWRVMLDGSASWRIAIPGGDTITSNEDQTDADADDHPTRASARLLAIISWGDRVVRQVSTNLFVAGELDYVAHGDEWQVVSVVHPDRTELLDADIAVKGMWPHPADPTRPDAPLFGVLPVLEELDWLSRLSRSQSANRVAQRGIIGAADGLSFAGGGDFWDELDSALHKSMVDPTDVGPLMVRGSQELVEPSGSGMKGLSWVVPSLPYDDKVDQRMLQAIQRLAYGLPIPPELLLGLQAQSRATAFQVEENSYRAHIEPSATLVAQVAEDALTRLLDEGIGTVEVRPDPTALLARRHSVQDVKDAFDRGAVSYAYLREVLAIPESAAAAPEDLALLDRVNGNDSAPETDPGNDAASETFAVAASVGGPAGEPLPQSALDALSDALGAIDASLLAELGGATQQATERARERIGAKARSREDLRALVPTDALNSEVPSHLGVSRLLESDVPITEEIERAVEPLIRWWTGRVEEAQSSVLDLLGEDADPGFTDNDVATSALLLGQSMLAHVTSTLDSPVASPLPSPTRLTVISAAGGSDA